MGRAYERVPDEARNVFTAKERFLLRSYLTLHCLSASRKFITHESEEHNISVLSNPPPQGNVKLKPCILRSYI
jgi:hypothetical protein